jgi:hypothetical protein
MMYSCAAIYGELHFLVKKYQVSFTLRISRRTTCCVSASICLDPADILRCRCKSSLRGYLVSFPRSGFLGQGGEGFQGGVCRRSIGGLEVSLWIFFGL